MNNELTVLTKEFEGNGVGIIIENGEPLFELYSTGMALGYTKVARRKIYAQKDRIDKIVVNAEVKLYFINNLKFIDKVGLKKLISMSNTINKLHFIGWCKQNSFIEFNEVFSYTRKEIEFFNKLEEFLQPFGYKVKRQMIDGKYRYDGFVKELNLVIEFDENGHSDYDVNKEIERENYIFSKGYKLIRIVDNKSPMHNIGLVMKYIISHIYKQDDNIVSKVVVEKNKSVETYKQGKIYICIKNS